VKNRNYDKLFSLALVPLSPITPFSSYWSLHFSFQDGTVFNFRPGSKIIVGIILIVFLAAFIILIAVIIVVLGISIYVLVCALARSFHWLLVSVGCLALMLDWGFFPLGMWFWCHEKWVWLLLGSG